MTPRNFLNFFRSRTGAIFLFLLLLAVVYMIIIRLNTSSVTRPLPAVQTSEKATVEPQIVETITREMTVYDPPKEIPTPSPSVPLPSMKKEASAPSLPPISLFFEPENSPHDADTLSDDYAPYGRLIQCELIVTVDSSSIDTPIIGLVTDDVWHNGRLIIPAGTEVHGTARTDRVRERIAGNAQWTFVWQTGEELKVNGVALDREKTADSDSWDITDGSAGLRGQLLKTDDFAEIKLFTASFLGGAASSLTEKRSTLFGSMELPSLQNAPLVGARQVLETYAKQILDTIQRDGFYVRVPAGKQFYLYVTQTMDKSKAMLGGVKRIDHLTHQN